MYTDTDSLLVDMSETKDEYDFSDNPKHHPLYDETNNKVIGKMKDECAGTPIAEYFGLRPKIYSVLRPDEQSKRGKKVCNQ